MINLGKYIPFPSVSIWYHYLDPNIPIPCHFTPRLRKKNTCVSYAHVLFLENPRIEETVKSFPNELALLDDGSGATYTYQAKMSRYKLTGKNRVGYGMIGLHP